MKILKYVFENERLGVVDGEVVTLDPELITCYFSLTVKATSLFEEEYGKPLINVLFKADKDEDISTGRFYRALASCMYLEVDNGKVLQNEITKEHFQDLEIYPAISNDLVFVSQLTDCAMQCIDDQVKKSTKNNKREEVPVKN